MLRKIVVSEKGSFYKMINYKTHGVCMHFGMNEAN